MPRYILSIVPQTLATPEPIYQGAALRWRGLLWFVDDVRVRDDRESELIVSPWPRDLTVPPTVYGEAEGV
jgi:hypothetical protein